MTTRSLLRAATIAIGFLTLAPAYADDPKSQHGIAMHGDLKYGADFKHFDYVNPNAPKGGKIRLGAIGGFDSLNPFIVKGNAAGGAAFVYDTLLTSSADEAFGVGALSTLRTGVAAAMSIKQSPHGAHGCVALTIMPQEARRAKPHTERHLIVRGNALVGDLLRRGGRAWPSK